MAQDSEQKRDYARPAKMERVASVIYKKQLPSTPEPSLPKIKGKNRLPRSLDREWERQRDREPHLDEKEEDRRESKRRKEWTPQ